MRSRKLAFALASLILLAVLIAVMPRIYAMYVGPWRQGVTLTINVLEESGTPARYARVKVFLLTSDGPKLIGEGGTFVSGVARVHVFIPRKPRGLLWKWEPFLEDGRVVRKFVETNEPSYASVNLGVIAIRPGEIGVRVFSLDPTKMRWPEDEASVTVKLEKPPSGKGGVSGAPPRTRPRPEDEISWWQFTPILKYATWDGIREWFKFNIGSKIEIQSKHQVCALWACGPWEDAGSTTVTLDRGLTGGYLTGRVVRTMYVKIKYVDWSYCDSFAGVCEDTIYAADTDMDFPDYYYVDKPWDGNLPSTGYTYLTHEGETTRLLIAGGYHWDLSVSINFGVDEGGPSVSLGVTFYRVSNPPSYLYIEGESRDPSYYVETVSMHGSGSQASCVVTYSNWVYRG